MDTRLLSAAVAIVDLQTSPEDDSWEVKPNRIWRWLDAIHEREPPEEQPAFDNTGEPLKPVSDQHYGSEVFQEEKQQQPKKNQILVEGNPHPNLPQRPSPSYGDVRIFRRSPGHGSASELNVEFRTRLHPGRSDKEQTIPPASSARRKQEALVRSKNNKSFAERVNDLGDPAWLCPPSGERGMRDPISIDGTGKRVSGWVRRLRADSKTASQRFFKLAR